MVGGGGGRGEEETLGAFASLTMPAAATPYTHPNLLTPGPWDLGTHLHHKPDPAAVLLVEGQPVDVESAADARQHTPSEYAQQRLHRQASMVATTLGLGSRHYSGSPEHT